MVGLVGRVFASHTGGQRIKSPIMNLFILQVNLGIFRNISRTINSRTFPSIYTTRYISEYGPTFTTVQGRGVRLEYLPWPFSLLSTTRREITLESCMSHFPGTWTPHAFFYIFAIKWYWVPMLTR
jgi:hypothetical protein